MATTKVSPEQTDQPPEYAQPDPQYGQPGPQYGQLGPQYGQPGPQYGQPAPQYGQPGPQYGQPGPQYGQPIIQQPTTTNTTIILQQPTVPVSTSRMWKSGICGCFDDVSSCIIVSALSFFGCTECYGCHLSSRLRESCCLCGCVPGYLIALRTKLRTEQNIQGSICDDCLMTSCCRPCVMCQMSRELDYCN